ncbi:hypothetical protein SAMN05444173_2943 [Opitutus sp. GAS368]|nr:hypothetical protein SAMN05444173_2943 [Opitutus sp. GAS368]
MSEEAISQLEAGVPALSGVAFAAARRHVLASGQSVLQSENGVLYEVFPDGHKVWIKNVEPPQPVIFGRKYTIR